jgi:hypothetical protein
MIPDLLPEKVEWVDLDTAENDYAELFIEYKKQKEKIDELESTVFTYRLRETKVEIAMEASKETPDTFDEILILANKEQMVRELLACYFKMEEKYEEQARQNKDRYNEVRKLNTRISEYKVLCSQENFPIQQTYGSHSPEPQTVIPYWLAEVAYEYYSEKFGSSQSLDRLAERGGFGRKELLMFLRKQIC